MSMLILFLVACGGSAPSPSAPEAAKTPAPAAAPAAPAPAAEVGPDGPTSIALPANLTLSTDAAVIAEGEKVFTAKGCNACHAWGSKLVGPDLTGVTTRRTVPWVARMIKSPEKMIKEDPQGKKLFAEFMTPMANQNVSDEDLVKLLSFLDSKK